MTKKEKEFIKKIFKNSLKTKYCGKSKYCPVDSVNDEDHRIFVKIMGLPESIEFYDNL